ncbi:hypothetical protein Tco_0192709, partial [Tanacetum coccineum]
SGGGFGDGAVTVDRPRGTNHRVTCGILIMRYEVLEADMAAWDWWIEGMTAAYD